MFVHATFSTRLKLLISDSEKLLDQIANETAISDTAIYRYLEQKRMPELKMFLKLADYFQCTSEYLLGLENQYYRFDGKPCPPFQKQFNYYIELKNTSVPRISEATGIAQTSLRNWKKGKNEPSIDAVMILANYFHVKIDDFIGR